MAVETYRFKVGAFQCIGINDGNIDYFPLPVEFPGAPPEELDTAIQNHPHQDGFFSIACTCLVIDTGSHRVMLETGSGTDLPPAGPMAPGYPSLVYDCGWLMEGLAAEGITPESIDTVMMSHAHGDHAGGTIDSAGDPAFPAARYVLPRGEWDMIMAWDLNDEAGWGKWLAQARHIVKQCVAIQDKLELVDPEIEVVPGIRMVPTPGHTANHTSIEVKSGGETLMCTMDAMHHPLLIEHPEWGPANEHEIESRKMILKRAGDGALIHGFHFPFPGLGRLRAAGHGWKWEKAE